MHMDPGLYFVRKCALQNTKNVLESHRDTSKGSIWNNV